MSRARDLGGRAVDALQNRNLVTNGGMQINQRGTSITGQTGYFYGPADRWICRLTTVGTWTASIETDVPSGTNLPKSLKYTCTTAATSYSAGERFAVSHLMEYQNAYKIFKPNSYNKKQVSLSFWVKSNVVGKYSVELFSQDFNSRRVAMPYTILQANTWERKTVTFPEDNSGRVLSVIVGESLALQFWGAAGPFYKTGTYTNVWDDVSQGNRYPSDGVNIASAINNYWQFTGVQLEVSPSSTDFEYIPYTTEILECQRFYYRAISESPYGVLGVGKAYNVNNLNINVPFPVKMRATPSISESDMSALSAFQFETGATAGTTPTSIIINSGIINSNFGAIEVIKASTFTVGAFYYLMGANNSNAYVGFSAEL